MTVRRPVVLTAVAAVALLLAGYFAWLTVFRPAAAPVRTTTTVNAAGGYALAVPRGMSVTRHGKATSLRDPARSLAVTVTATGRTAPRATGDVVVAAMRRSYPTVTVLGTRQRTVDHRPARETYGAVVTPAGQRAEFVLVVVRGPRANYALSAFSPFHDSVATQQAARTSTVSARFDAVVAGFRMS